MDTHTHVLPHSYILQLVGFCLFYLCSATDIPDRYLSLPVSGYCLANPTNGAAFIQGGSAREGAGSRRRVPRTPHGRTRSLQRQAGAPAAASPSPLAGLSSGTGRLPRPRAQEGPAGRRNTRSRPRRQRTRGRGGGGAAETLPARPRPGSPRTWRTLGALRAASPGGCSPGDRWGSAPPRLASARPGPPRSPPVRKTPAPAFPARPHCGVIGGDRAGKSCRLRPFAESPGAGLPAPRFPALSRRPGSPPGPPSRSRKPAAVRKQNRKRAPAGGIL